MSAEDRVSRERKVKHRISQSKSYKEKIEYIEKLRALLAPALSKKEDTRFILRFILKAFKSKFPASVGTDNGCRFRRTVEYGYIRRSIWVTSEIQHNFELFHDKVTKESELEIKEAGNQGQVETQVGSENDLGHTSNGSMQNLEIQKSQSVTPTTLLNTCTDINCTSESISQQLPETAVFPAGCQAMPVPEDRIPFPRYSAVYPEQRTVFGLSHLQQLEYENNAKEVEGYNNEPYIGHRGNSSSFPQPDCSIDTSQFWSIETEQESFSTHIDLQHL